MSLRERRVALPRALSSVAAEAPVPVLSLEAPLAHSHPPDHVGEQGARRVKHQTELGSEENSKPSGMVRLCRRVIPG